MTRYPTVEDVIALNLELAGPAGGVRDQGVVESAVNRPQQGFGGVEAHPTLWDKAAALLHGLAATQGFQDGNKRTAWVVTETFLAANGHQLTDMPDVVAQAFALAVSTSSLDLERIAEWLQHYEMDSELPAPRHPQLDYAFLARAAQTGADGDFTALGAQVASVTVSAVPVVVPLSIVVRLFWTPADVGREHRLLATFATEGSDEPVENIWSDFVFVPPVRSGHPGHPHGLMPALAALDLVAVIEQEGRYEVRLQLDDAPLERLPLNVAVSPFM